MTPRDLTDDDLIVRLAALASVERASTAALIAHLAELESRRLHLAQGFRSLFGYCRHVLHFSEHEAYNRMEAVHAARRFPVIVALLADGRLHVTAVRLLAPHLKDEDHLALLGGAFHKSRREILGLIARWFPSPDVVSSVRKLPNRTTQTVLPAEALNGTAPEPPAVEKGLASPAWSEPPPSSRSTRRTEAHRPTVAPLSSHRYKLEVTLEQEAHDDLRWLQDAMRREIRDGNPAMSGAGPPDDAGRSREEDLRRYREAAASRQDEAGIPPRTRPRPARRLDKGRGPMRVRGQGRAAMHRAQLPGIPPCRAVRVGWRSDDQEHLAPLPRS